MDEKPLKILFTRADDVGLCASVNRAACDAVSCGILRNVSLMVQAPAFPEAAEIFRDMPDIDFGLHITLTAEWPYTPWGPVLPAAELSALLDERGLFLNSTKAFCERKISLEIMLAETMAQLEKARSSGLKITYLEDHMCVFRAMGLNDELSAFAESEGLINSSRTAPPLLGSGEKNTPTQVAEKLRNSQAGSYLLVGHPMYDDEEARFVTRGRGAGASDISGRDLQRRSFMDAEVLAACRECDIYPARFSEFNNLLTQEPIAKE